MLTILLRLVDNPICMESGVTDKFCSLPTTTTTSYSTPPNNCVPSPCISALWDQMSRSGGIPQLKGARSFSFEELKKYTNNFSETNNIAYDKVLTAIDYVVSLSSDVFLPSHDGHMARALQGHRAYVGHKKFLTVNTNSKGQPEPRTKRRDRDLIAFPVPECMCSP